MTTRRTFPKATTTVLAMEGKMKSLIPVFKSILISIIIMVGATVSGSLSAKEPSASLKEQIIGTWLVVSQYVDQDGKKLEPFGANPKGIAVFDRNGRFVFVGQRGSLPKFASNNRLTGTAEENQAIVQGSIAYFGRYWIDENEQKIHYHFEGSTYPNWDGEDQIRIITLSGDELTTVSSVSAVGGGAAHLVLRREK